MKNKRFVLVSWLILGVLFLSGCGVSSENPADSPGIVLVTNTPVTVDGVDQKLPLDSSPAVSDSEATATVDDATVEPPSDFPQVIAVSETALVARDKALFYIANVYSELVFPQAGLDWFTENLTPEGLVGGMTYRFTTGDLAVTLSYPVVLPENMIYHILFENAANGFSWEGEVDASGAVSELAVNGSKPVTDDSQIGDPISESTVVVGWVGYVSSTPQGAQFDDFFTFDFARGAREFGVAGLNEAVELEIQGLRDQEEPGKYAHFWGRLRCGVPVADYEGCQLVVERVLTGTDISDPEPIEGWAGEIRSAAPGAQYSQYFVLSGDYPVRYGISSFITEDGRALFEHEELDNLRDTGVLLSVSGQLVCGVMDVNGCQIQVKHFEVLGSYMD